MNILIVDDEEGLRKGIKKILSLHGYRVFGAANCSEARDILKKEEVHILLLDLNLGIEKGLDFLKAIKEEEPLLSAIIITGYGNIESAVECMKAGAINYITKPIAGNLLLSILKRERQELQSRQENIAFRELLESASVYKVIRSCHAQMQKIEHIVDKVKDKEVTVLISGETGTGKEITARKIHYSGAYRERPYICINCAALNNNLLESELFGHERGAFTSAVAKKMGRFELAGRGTLFLDEVGDMSLAMQSKLLRVLQEKTFERVGGIKTLTAHCRIIASTNRDLKKLIAEGNFRRDLYYRLSLITISLPPLRERIDDISALVELFIAEANRKYNKEVSRLSPAVLTRLKEYTWPGNIRQLKNIITNAVILSDDYELSGIELPQRILEEEISLPGESLKSAVDRHTGVLEKGIIKQVLVVSGGNISKSASELGITRKTLYDKMKRYGL
jgi:two-component system response regulator AtoC